jgi:hypothetical protein
MAKLGFSSYLSTGVICSALSSCAVALALVSCATPRAPTVATAPSPSPKANRSGTLVTYKSGRELWREEYQDDGDTLQSRLSLGAQTATVRTSRSSRTVVVEEGPHRVERDIPSGTIALENGDWQAYAIAAEWYADAQEPRPVQVLVPGQGAVVDGTIAVARRPDGRRDVRLTLGSMVIEVAIDADGKVFEARVPAQGLEVRLPDVAARSNSDSQPQSDPANAVRHAIEMQHDGGTLAGEFWSPKRPGGPVPLAIIVPGSGPTDRDGNSSLGLRTNSYRQIAAALADRGIATLRYDKRGVGRSQGYREDGMTLETSCRDLVAMVQQARQKGSFSSLTLVGHSEGGLVALKSMGDVRADAVVLLATPGRMLGAVLREQLVKGGVPATEVDKALLETRNGDIISSARREIQAIFRPSVIPFLRSVLDVDPATVLRNTTLPTTIVQGDTDLQISLQDAELLHAARPDARMVVVHGMNHVLKEDASKQVPQRSYTDPAVPLAAPVIDAIADAPRR